MINYNLKDSKAPSEIYREESATGNYSSFINRFLAYTSSSKVALSVSSFVKEPALNLMRDIFTGTYIFHIEKPDGVQVDRGMVYVNEKDELIIVTEAGNFPLTYNDESVIIKDVTKPLLSVINGELNSNFPDVFFRAFERQLYNLCLGRVFSRYSVYTKRTMLKDLQKVKWVNNGNGNDLRWGIKEVERKVGIIEREYELNNGKKMMGLAPKAKMIHSSFSGSTVALQPWGEAFPEESAMLIQGGDMGIVFSSSGNYTTAFVEVFPRYINDGDRVFSSFIRGEGKDMAEAELKAFEKVTKAKNCGVHDWNPKGRTDGCGYCNKCGVFDSDAFPELKTKKDKKN